MNLLPRSVFSKFSLAAALSLLLPVQNASAQPAITSSVAPNPATSRTVSFVPYADPWASAKERWWDYKNRQFDAFVNGSQSFAYNGGQVTLTYDTAPGVPYFVGHIEARGLKPNFVYQMKLVGKPVKGTLGWGAQGNDWSNDAIGKAGRWWCANTNHAAGTNFNDTHYRDYYANATGTGVHNIYGYQFLGDFVTDENGNASVDFTGAYSYHITWASWQGGLKDTLFGSFTPYSTSSYGYGYTFSSSDPVTLYYEYEPNGSLWPRSQAAGVVLPNGNYNCRFMLTEESFHNNLGGGTNGDLGGYWKSVLVTEDFVNGQPDSNPSNDVSFSIGLPRVPTGLTATPGNAQVALSWTAVAGATSYNVKRATISGGPYTTIASPTSTGLVDNAAANGTTYYYVVSAVNSVGQSTNSNEANATPQLAAPQAPTNLTTTAGNGQVQLTWTASFGADSYNIKRAEVSGGPYTTLNSSTTVGYTDTGLTNGTTYYYVVSALNNAGESSDSAEKSATPIVQPAATPIINPNGGTYFGSVSVSLSSANGASLYYTTNGTDPTQASTLYSAPFTLTSSATVKARAFKDGFAASNIASAAFTINKIATFNPTDDAHVQAGNVASRNFGTATTMEVKTSTSAKENRDAYLKFNLQSLPGGTITSARLRIYTALSASGSINTSLYAVSNTTWTQGTINWNNKPTRGSVLGNATVTSTAYAWKEIVITSYIQAELAAGRKTISLALHNTANISPLIKVNSREAASFKPELVING